jgi:hypothetical protein
LLAIGTPLFWLEVNFEQSSNRESWLLIASPLCIGLAIAAFCLSFIRRTRRRTGQRFTHAPPGRYIALILGMTVTLAQAPVTVTLIRRSSRLDVRPIWLTGLLGPLLIVAFATGARRLAIAGLALALIGTASPWMELRNLENLQYVCLTIPFTVAALLCSCAAAIRAMRQRRAPGLCLRCGYDLAGNVSGTCPECGQPIADGTSSPSRATHRRKLPPRRPRRPSRDFRVVLNSQFCLLNSAPAHAQLGAELRMPPD